MLRRGASCEISNRNRRSNSHWIFILVYPELFGRRAVTSAKHKLPPFVQITQNYKNIVLNDMINRTKIYRKIFLSFSWPMNYFVVIFCKLKSKYEILQLHEAESNYFHTRDILMKFLAWSLFYSKCFNVLKSNISHPNFLVVISKVIKF